MLCLRMLSTRVTQILDILPLDAPVPESLYIRFYRIEVPCID